MKRRTVVRAVGILLFGVGYIVVLWYIRNISQGGAPASQTITPSTDLFRGPQAPPATGGPNEPPPDARIRN